MRAKKLVKYIGIVYNWKVRASLLPPLPDEVSIEATNVCNFKCKFCPQSDPNHHNIVPKNYLSPQRAEEIMQKLRDGGISTKTLHWTLDGEPFMNKYFHELCEIAVMYEFNNMFFATNGMLLTENVLDRLPKGKGIRYTFTIDYCADKEYFDKVRGSKGSWDKVYKNIRSSLDNTFHESIFFMLSDITPFEESDQEKIEENFYKLKYLFGEGKRIRYHKKTFHNAAGLLQSSVNIGDRNRYYLCPYPWASLYIASSGDVVACCRDLRRQTKLGNILEQSLQEIWHGTPYQDLRSNLVDQTPWKTPACNGCDLPYDSAKFSLVNIVRTARGRLQIFGNE
ncbi:MAG: radical SAM/SPASM domain-containing protein [Rhodomicrobium sp.]